MNEGDEMNEAAVPSGLLALKKIMRWPSRPLYSQYKG